jgi:GT2 family glycosyltransferase
VEGKSVGDTARAVGIVIIGRNEGERLKRCLESLRDYRGRMVYVDSGSTDGSVDLAGAMGADVVALDLRRPFTAARARSEGYRQLRATLPGLAYVQFIDGDCQIAAGWIDKAAAWLEQHPEVAVACGRRRERYPDRSVYNMLCDLEWDTPTGEAKACGGDALMRIESFESVNGFREDLIAGEEPEICVRLRAAGWKIWRLDAEMTLHDAAILRFGQWWRRTTRAGYAFAQGAHLHGASPERHCVRESRSALMWGLGLPLGVAVAALAWNPWAALLLAAYPLQVGRIALGQVHGPERGRWRYAAFLVLAKFPEALGQLRFMYRHLTGERSRLIEYK